MSEYDYDEPHYDGPSEDDLAALAEIEQSSVDAYATGPSPPSDDFPESSSSPPARNASVAMTSSSKVSSPSIAAASSTPNLWHKARVPNAPLLQPRTPTMTTPNASTAPTTSNTFGAKTSPTTATKLPPPATGSWRAPSTTSIPITGNKRPWEVASFGVPETKEKEDDAPLMYPCKVCGKDIMKKYNVNGNPCYRCCGQFTNPPSVSFKRPKTEHAAAAIDDGMPDTYPCKVCKQPIHKRAGKNGSFYLCCKVFTNPPKPAGANGSAYNNTGKAPRTDNIVKNGRMVPCKVCTNALPERMGKNARSFWLCYVCDQFTYP